MKDKVNYNDIIIKLHNFCVNCSDNIFMEFVWVRTIKKLQSCDESKAIEIINHLKKKNILISSDSRKLILNKNIHRNTRYMTNV
jgi:hypothetical protein